MPSLNGALAQYNASLVDLDERNRYGRTPLNEVIDASPALKANLQTAFNNGYLSRFDFSRENDGSGGSYSIATQTMNLNSSSFSDRANLVFVLGHETQHALSLQGQPEPHFTAMQTAINTLSQPLGVQAGAIDDNNRRDYTGAIGGYIEGVRREEAQAHIGGFNAYNSYMTQRLGHAPSAQELYEGLPGRMSDFITKSGISPFTSYNLKAGLTRGDDGAMALDDANIDRMKVYYADKFPGTFGDNGLLDYRHQAALTGWRLVQDAEQSISFHASTRNMNHSLQQPAHDLSAYDPAANSYKIDFAALGLNRAVMKYPADGVVTVVDTHHAITTAAFAGHPMAGDVEQRFRDTSDPVKGAVVATAEATDRLREQGLLPHTVGSRMTQLGRALGFNAIDDAGPVVQGQASDPPLLSQAKSALETQGVNGGLKDRESFENASAALALQAQRDGLASIDSVVKNLDGDRLIAIQGQDPASPTARHASVELATAVRTPAPESAAGLQAPPQEQEPQRQAPKSMTV